MQTITHLVRSNVDTRLSSWLTERNEQWALLGEPATELLETTQVLVRGGKRMRAVLAALALSWYADDEAARSTAVTNPLAAGVGAALELYQASALIHDDVIDCALTRRGEPAAHRRLAHLHRDSAWLASADDFGVHGAILLGDLLLSAAGEEFATATHSPGLSPKQTQAARALFDAMTTEVAVGQYLDIRAEVTPLPPQEADPVRASEAMQRAAVEVIIRKSARYSVMYPLLIGATLAGIAPTSATAHTLRRFGQAVGIAFQLRDDALGVTGDPALTGKPVGDDLREGKRTVLLALAWQHTDSAGRTLLREVLANPTAPPNALERACTLIDTCGALAAHEERISYYLSQAQHALEDLSPTHISTSMRELLWDVALMLGTRQA